MEDSKSRPLRHESALFTITPGHLCFELTPTKHRSIFQPRNIFDNFKQLSALRRRAFFKISVIACSIMLWIASIILHHTFLPCINANHFCNLFLFAFDYFCRITYYQNALRLTDLCRTALFSNLLYNTMSYCIASYCVFAFLQRAGDSPHA